MNAIEREAMTEEQYDEALNDIYGEVNVCGYYYEAARALKELDPIAYDCGMSDMMTYEYECSECGEVYEDRDEAEDCCKQDKSEEE